MRKARFMVVEGEEAVASALGRLVQHFGHALAGCHRTAETALAACEADRPDVAIVDLGVPGGGEGLAVTRQLAGRHGVRVIALCANAGACDAFDAGARVVLVKPFDAARVEQALSCAAAGEDAYVSAE